MLCQLLTLASITPYDREAHKHEARRREQQRYERLARGEPAAKQVLRSRLGEVAGMAMSLEAHRAVAEMDAEESKSGAFRRVYPTANGHVHRHIFAQERPLNTMLCEVLRQRAADVANAAEHDLDAISGAARGAARPSEGVPPTDPADAPGSAPTTELADAASAIAQAPPKAATRLAEALGEGQQQQQQKPPQPPQPSQQPQQPQQMHRQIAPSPLVRRSTIEPHIPMSIARLIDVKMSMMCGSTSSSFSAAASSDSLATARMTIEMVTATSATTESSDAPISMRAAARGPTVSL